MCIILEGEYTKIGEAIHHFIITAKASEVKDVEEELKDYLSDLRDAKKIAYCGCNGPFKVKKEEDSYVVFMQILNMIVTYTITREGFTIGTGSFSDIIDDYNGWQENLEAL